MEMGLYRTPGEDYPTTQLISKHSITAFSNAASFSFCIDNDPIYRKIDNKVGDSVGRGYLMIDRLTVLLKVFFEFEPFQCVFSLIKLMMPFIAFLKMSYSAFGCN